MSKGRALTFWREVGLCLDHFLGLLIVTALSLLFAVATPEPRARGRLRAQPERQHARDHVLRRAFAGAAADDATDDAAGCAQQSLQLYDLRQQRFERQKRFRGHTLDLGRRRLCEQPARPLTRNHHELLHESFPDSNGAAGHTALRQRRIFAERASRCAFTVDRRQWWNRRQRISRFERFIGWPRRRGSLDQCHHRCKW